MAFDGGGDGVNSGASGPAMLLVLAGIPIVWIVGLWWRIFAPPLR